MSEEKKKVFKGLKKLRNSLDKEPTYRCDNCKCIRYTPCTCMKKGER